jgi:hypothetical protein
MKKIIQQQQVFLLFSRLLDIEQFVQFIKQKQKLMDKNEEKKQVDDWKEVVSNLPIMRLHYVIDLISIFGDSNEAIVKVFCSKFFDFKNEEQVSKEFEMNFLESCKVIIIIIIIIIIIF